MPIYSDNIGVTEHEAKLLTLDRELRAEADELLERRGLRNLLEEYSPIAVIGSYALNLMVWRDLDVIMDAPSITVEEFFDLGSRITTLLSAWKMFFTENREHASAEPPNGLYWGIRLGDTKSGAWKIDLWAFDSDEFRHKQSECGDLMRRVTPQNRLTILDLKSSVWRDPRYRKLVTSQDIYTAVLKHGIGNVEEFWRYAEDMVKTT